MVLKRFTLILAFMLFIAMTYPVHGLKVELKERLTFSSQTEKPMLAKDFSVTDDGLIIIPDHDAGNIKIYEKNNINLVLVQTIGSKGYGPDQLIKPRMCTYSAEENRLAVLDVGLHKIFIYNRLGRLDFERDKVEIPCWRGAYDIQIKNERLYVAGYADDPSNPDNGYEFYSVDLKNDQKTQYLLSSTEKYNSLKDYQIYGIQGWFDIKDDTIYFVWEGNPQRIIQMDSLAGFPSTFALKTPESAPRLFSSADKKQLEDLKNKKDFQQVERLKVQLTPLARNLFITKQNNILMIVEGPFAAAGTTSFLAELFADNTLKGKEYISSIPVTAKLFYEKNSSTLYAISGDKVLQYKVTE